MEPWITIDKSGIETALDADLALKIANKENPKTTQFHI
jgi:hypothetical protein